MSWSEVVFTAPDHQHLMSSTIGPLLAALRDDGVPGLVLRGSDAGDDVRLLVQAGATAESLAPRLAGFPYSPGAASAVMASPLNGPVFGGRALDRTTRGFLAEVAPITVDLGTRGDDRLTFALQVMTTHLGAVADPARATTGGPPLSFLSFRSHAEAFITTARNPTAAREALEGYYLAHRDTVESCVGTILRDAEPGDATGWEAAVRATKPAVAGGFRSGALTARSGHATDQPGTRAEFARNPFHRTVAASDDLQSYLRAEPSFLATRLLTSMLYLTLHAAGVALAERFVLCYAISRACESLYSVDSVAMLTTLGAAAG